MQTRRLVTYVAACGPCHVGSLREHHAGAMLATDSPGLGRLTLVSDGQDVGRVPDIGHVGAARLRWPGAGKSTGCHGGVPAASPPQAACAAQAAQRAAVAAAYLRRRARSAGASSTGGSSSSPAASPLRKLHVGKEGEEGGQGRRRVVSACQGSQQKHLPYRGSAAPAGRCHQQAAANPGVACVAARGAQRGAHPRATPARRYSDALRPWLPSSSSTAASLPQPSAAE